MSDIFDGMDMDNNVKIQNERNGKDTVSTPRQHGGKPRRQDIESGPL